MDTENINRRDFLQVAAAAGIAALSASAVFNVTGAETASPQKKKIYLCGVCGHVEFGKPPERCPICRSPKEKFEQSDALFSESAAKFKSLAAEHAIIITAKKKSAVVTEAPSISVQARVGKPIHPSTDEHRIRFIDCYIDDVYVGCTLPTTRLHPAAGFEIKTPGSVIRVVALCTLHGYWQKEMNVS